MLNHKSYSLNTTTKLNGFSSHIISGQITSWFAWHIHDQFDHTKARTLAELENRVEVEVEQATIYGT